MKNKAEIISFLKNLKNEKIITLMSLLGIFYSFISSFIISTLYVGGNGLIRILNLGRGGPLGLTRTLWFNFSLIKLFLFMACLIIFIKTKKKL